MNLNLLLIITAVILLCMVVDGEIPDLFDFPADHLCCTVPAGKCAEQLL